MFVEIRRTGFENKGAELMLYSVLNKMQENYPNAEFVMAPHQRVAPYQKRARLGFYQKAYLPVRRFSFSYLFNFIPKKIRDMYGIVVDAELDVVLDAAGFAYSQQWGEYNSLEMAASCKLWRRNGTKVILLPQAFGPFESSRMKDAIKTIVDNADLIFAREKVSYDYLVEVVGERPNLKIAPDFTNLIEGILPYDFDIKSNRFCIVPNYRMIDKTSKDQSDAYLPFMITSAKYLLEKGSKPFILIHEGENDLMLAEKINAAVGGVIPIVKETDPLKIKGILGACDATLGSRFHGLVSALSQGVPSLATGWSHKYLMLFEDYGFPDGVLNVTESKEQIYSKLDLLINKSSRDLISKTLNQHSSLLKAKSENMWDEVFYVLNQ